MAVDQQAQFVSQRGLRMLKSGVRPEFISAISVGLAVKIDIGDLRADAA